MKKCILLWLIPVTIFGCRQGLKEESKIIPVTDNTVDTSNFFPLTSYIKGQLVDIREIGVTPIGIDIKKDRQDTTWLKWNEFESAIAAFLTPVIDTTNLKGLFSQKNFLDQTINAITFTYDSIKVLPDNFQLKHWDVYVNPETQLVNRIYLVKDLNPETRELLTWQTEEGWCTILRLKHNNGANIVTESEKRITWKY